MDKVTCYICNGKGSIKARSSVHCISCKENPSDIYDCITCASKRDPSELIDYVCFMCHGRGEIDWIDNLFRRM